MNLSRRGVLAATAASGVAVTATLGRAATFGNPDMPPEGAVNVTNPKVLTIPGPHDASLADTMPSFLSPPPTDVGSMPQFWASFNLAPRRIQNGGWGPQVTQSDFAISADIAGITHRTASWPTHGTKNRRWALIVRLGNVALLTDW
jgi:oxalate decarboxylase